jgi:hypothetical protein
VRSGEPCAQAVGRDEVLERRLAVDLDHGKTLAVARLELRSPADVDQLELEVDLLAQLEDDLERSRAEAAVVRVVDRYLPRRPRIR